MRLIDADELKKSLNYIYDCAYIDSMSKEGVASDIIDEIDNAPTVAVNCKDCDGYEAGYSAGLKDAERPQGEWIVTGEEQGALGVIYKTRKCNRCGWENSLLIPRNFCPKCGADMRGDTE